MSFECFLSVIWVLFECFKNNKRTRQLTLSWRRPLSYRNQSIDLLTASIMKGLIKCCVKYLDNCKKLIQQTKCKHGRQITEVKFVSKTRKNQNAKAVVKVKLVSTTGQNHLAKIVGKSNLWAQQDKIKIQKMWPKSNLGAEQVKIILPFLWQKPDLWAQQSKTKL